MTSQETNTKYRSYLLIALEILIIGLAIAVGFLGRGLYDRFRGDLSMVKQAQELLVENTILEIPSEKALEYAMIRGMLSAMDDPFTFFVEPAAHEIQSDDLAGSFGGIGVRIERDTDGEWRIYPLPDSPAEEAGLQDGDQLLKVDDLIISASLDEITILAALRGPEGEAVNIEIKRNEKMLAVKIPRAAYTLPSVTWNLLPEAPQIGIIQIQRMADSTPTEIEDAFVDLDSQGALGFILDLRGNGGGLVGSGVAIAQLFLDEGVILAQAYRDAEVETFMAEAPAPLLSQPLVILINGNTASAAEILAGALQVNKRALLIGTPSYGKNTIQFVFDLSDGSSIHVTSGRWWIPDQVFPLAPDRLVTDDADGTQTLKAAINTLLDQLDTLSE